MVAKAVTGGWKSGWEAIPGARWRPLGVDRGGSEADRCHIEGGEGGAPLYLYPYCKPGDGGECPKGVVEGLARGHGISLFGGAYWPLTLAHSDPTGPNVFWSCQQSNWMTWPV